MKHIPRFFVNNLSADEEQIVFLSDPQMYHASKVLRLNIGDRVYVFNDIIGEWDAVIESTKQNSVRLRHLKRKPFREAGPAVACALINPARFAWMAEKVTELGASEIYPVVTEFSQYQNINTRKIEQIIVQAAEQSCRLSVPKLHNNLKLDLFFDNYCKDKTILVGIEGNNFPPLRDVICENCIFLIGPEGGFSEREIEKFKTLNNVKCFHNGQTILRSETAAISFVSDWEYIYLK